MKTMTVQLAEDEAQFLETYAQEHAISVAELLARYARRLRQHLPPHPDNVKFTGTVPAEVDAREEHRRHLENKHR